MTREERRKDWWGGEKGTKAITQPGGQRPGTLYPDLELVPAGGERSKVS